jgi:phosphoserine phosphatase
MTSTVEPLWLFDLDGTIIDTNSFPLWTMEILAGRLPHLDPMTRLCVSARCAAALAARKVLRQSHAQFKSRLQRLWSEVTAAHPNRQLLESFIDRLMTHVRPALQDVLEDVAKSRIDAILTTAAAAEYAQPLAQRLGFRHVIATPSGGLDPALDNVGATKRQRTLEYIAQRGWVGRPRIFFTDHRDDLPLIGECQAVVWFGEDQEETALRAMLPGIVAFAARELSAGVAQDWAARQRRGGSATCT